MQIYPNQLKDSLKKGLLPVYVTGGPEIVLLDEVRDAIIAAAQADGVEDIEVLRFDTRRNVPWPEVFDELSEGSLFGTRKILEVRVPVSVMDERVVASCTDLAQTQQSNVLLVRLSKSDYRDKRKKWYNALRSARDVAFVVADELKPSEAIDWVIRKATELDLRLPRPAAEKLADYCENNLISARQELDKFKLLLDPGGTIDEAEIELADVRNADLFQLLDALFSGDIATVAKRLVALEDQRGNSSGYERRLMTLLTQSLKLAYAKLSVPSTSVPGYQRSRVDMLIQRHGAAGIEKLLVECAQFDSMNVGMARGDRENLFRNLLFAVAGLRAPVLDHEYYWRAIDRTIN